VYRLLAENSSLRRFFAAFLQSQIGTGAAAVALPLVAYQRLHSSWAISLVLLGELLPGIVLTPVCGALADRCSRRRLVVFADLLRAACYLALALTPSFALTVGFALLAGTGRALFRPTVSAALPGLVDAERRSQVTAIFWASVNSGLLIGPALAAAILLVTGPSTLLLINALTFLFSAALLANVDLGRGESLHEPEAEPRAASVWHETVTGAQAIARIPGVSLVLAVASLVVLTSAMFNVIAPLLATGPLHLRSSGYSVLMALYGAGMVGGSWFAARAGSQVASLRRRWLWGIALSGVTMSLAALAPDLAAAGLGFLLIGLAETLLVGPEMRLIQEMVGEALLGRAFGLKDVLENIALVIAFVSAAWLTSLLGVRATFLGAGLLTVALAAGARIAGAERPSVRARPRHGLRLLLASALAQRSH
jgi:MFS family permease